MTPMQEYSRREPDPTTMDNIETGILADFLKRWSALGIDVRIEHGEDGTLYFYGGQGESCTVHTDGSAHLDVNYH